MRILSLALPLSLIAMLSAATRVEAEGRPDSLGEAFAEMLGNPYKAIVFKKDDGPRCPETVSLISAWEADFQVYTPMLKQGGSSYQNRREATQSGEIALTDFGYCRYIITVKRYEIVEGREKQLALVNLADPSRPRVSSPASIRGKQRALAIMMRRLEAAKAKSATGAVAETPPPEKEEPAGLGHTSGGMRWAGATSSATFSGLIYSGPRAVTVAIVHAPPDMLLDVDEVDDPNVIVLNIRTDTTRTELSMSREVLVSGEWQRVPAK